MRNYVVTREDMIYMVIGLRCVLGLPTQMAAVYKMNELQLDDEYERLLKLKNKQ